MGTVSYTTREDVVGALGDTSPEARTTTVIDRAIDSGSRSVEALCRRVFYPTDDARLFQRADDFSVTSRLWLDQNEAHSVASVDVDGNTANPNLWQLFPGDGPPYSSIYFPAGPSQPVQGTTTVTGVFGGPFTLTDAGMTVGTWDDSASALGVSDGGLVGVGDLLTVDDERLLVTGRAWADSGDTLASGLTASNADTGVQVADGSGFHPGEAILLDAERMLITDITGNTLIVKRAQGGTVLAAHTGSTVYASRTLIVVRGATGTTADAHLTGAMLWKNQAPGLVRALSLAEAVNEVQLVAGGYGVSTGSGANAATGTAKGLTDLRQRVYAGFGRKGRVRTV